MPSVEDGDGSSKRTAAGSDGADSDGSLSWEDFFGSTTAEDLVPTLLTMYDTLVGRHQQQQRRDVSSSSPSPATSSATTKPAVVGGGGGGCARPQQPPPPPPTHHVPRPLSVTSIASSSSSSSSSGWQIAPTYCESELYCDNPQSLRRKMASKRRNMFQKNKTQETTENGSSSSGSRRLANVAKGSPYLASIESLDDTEDESPSPNTTHTSHRSGGDSGVCSPCSYISSPSPPHTKPKYCDPHLSYMDRVVMEIVETEGVYVNDLAQVIIGYLERWETCAEPPLNETQLTHLFSNLRNIYNFNGTFLRELEQCGLDPVKVARVFVKNNSGFSIYTEYCTSYPRTVGVLTELMRKESTARLFRERQAALQHTLPLGSYLLKPVQRILKYHLLLQNIVKNLQPDAEGYGSVVDALSTMTGIAHHINEMKRKHEHAVRVQEIQSLLLGWHGEDLTTFGELCAEGTFRMAGAKALRHAFLFDQILLITKKKEEGILGYKAHIMCSNLMLIESVPGEPLSFHVIPFDNPRHQYTLQARSLEQKREWTLQLKRVILENYNAVIPSHARQLVMQLGQNRSDDEIMAERATPKKQHSAPEYLERRKQERERRKSETGIRARLRTRSRKQSDAGIPIKNQQRIRRNSQYRLEDGAMLPAESSMEQCGGMRRMSEPGYYPNSGGVGGRMLAREDSESSIATPADDLARPGVKTQGESPFSERGGVTTQEEEEEGEERGADKKRTLEEIVSQLLMQNKEFQRVLKKQRHGLGGTRRHHRAETTTSEDEPEESRGAASPGAGFGLSRSTRSLSLNQPRVSPDYDNLQDIWIGGGLKRAQSFGSHQAGGVYSSSETASLAGSRTSFGASGGSRSSFGMSRSSFGAGGSTRGGPTSPAVWLKQQHQHLPTPTQHKAGSLPRGFQLGNTAPPPQPWQTRISPDRPFTIASDKPQDLNNLLDGGDLRRMSCEKTTTRHCQHQQELDLLEDMEDYAHQQQKRTSGADTSGGFPPVVDDTTEEESAGGTPDASTHHLDDLHPEYRIYRTSITTRQTLRQVLSSVSSKLASLRLSSETLDQMDVEQRASRLVNAFARTFRGSKRFDDSDLPVYKQGSSGLGARIAHGTEISDYADPRTLFPSITPSKKAASLLGIRPYSVLSLVSNLTSSSSSGYAGSSGSQSSGPVPQEPPQEMREGVDSDGSADSYYERTFEAMESSMSDTRCRDSAIFSDPEDILSPPPPPVRKVPPPIPRKPNNLKPPAIRPPPATPNSITPTTPDRLDDECDSTSSVASTVIENTTTTKGWVKHVICKIQGGTD